MDKRIVVLSYMMGGGAGAVGPIFFSFLSAERCNLSFMRAGFA